MIERRARAGDVAYLLEPDLKDGHGGLRDVQTLRWAGDADLPVPADDQQALDHCEEPLVTVRVALHRATGRAGDVLRLEDQEASPPLAAPVRRRADGRRRCRGTAGGMDRRRAPGGTLHGTRSATRSASARASSSSTGRSS